MSRYPLLVPFLWLLQQLLLGCPCIEAGTVENALLNCPACAFDGLDAPDCKLYGDLWPGQDGSLTAWTVASEACLDAYQVDVSTFDHSIISQVWTNGLIELPPTSIGVEKFVTWLESANNGQATMQSEMEVIRQVQLEFLSDYFQEESAGSGVEGRVVFRDRVQMVGQGQEVDCLESEFSCWTAVREYLETTPSTVGAASARKSGHELLSDIGQVLEQWKRRDLEREQASVRMELCRDGGGRGGRACQGPLVDEVMQQRNDNPSLDCSAMGNGPPHGGGYHTMLPPEPVDQHECHLDEGGGQYGTLHRHSDAVVASSSSSSSSSSSARFGAVVMAGLVVVWGMLVSW
ncbi:hypothetical protein ACA910_020065 [Epithemia clementina (nom. ined.)]